MTTNATDDVHSLVEMIFELRYSLGALAMRCKRAGLDVEAVALSKNDEDFLMRETEEVLTRHCGASLKDVVTSVARHHLEAVRKATADREGDSETM